MTDLDMRIRRLEEAIDEEVNYARRSRMIQYLAELRWQAVDEEERSWS